jgi:predicted nucleotidyltransferase
LEKYFWLAFLARSSASKASPADRVKKAITPRIQVAFNKSPGDETMLTRKTILAKLKKNKERLKGYGVKHIGLFGSYSRGNQAPGSDVDILVEFAAGKKTFDNFMELKFFLEQLFESEVDLVIAESIKPDLKPYILESVEYAAGL